MRQRTVVAWLAGLSLLLAVLATLGMLWGGAGAPVPTTLTQQQVGATLLLNEEYRDAVLPRLVKARRRIWLFMYVLRYDESRPFGPEVKFLKALADGHRQGVDVRVILDASNEWDGSQNKYSEQISEKNESAYRWLKSRGVPVRYDSLRRTLHSKAIVIDHDASVVGSTNWTSAALSKNVESAVLLESSEINSRLAAAFEELWEKSGAEQPRKQ